MPKFGLKCFLGSFLLSLTAVFVATKAYLIISLNEKASEDISLNSVETRNIELFASTEENDPIYEKFNQIEIETSLAETSVEKDAPTSEGNQIADADTPLYSPDALGEDSDESSFAVASTDTATTDISIPETPEQNSEDLIIVQNENDKSAETSSVKTEEFEIVDASLAPTFNIPLLHGFSTASSTVSVSTTADNNQIAMSSHDVAVGNLGLDKKASVTETAVSVGNSQDVSADVVDDPWDVAEAANKHISKNTLQNTETKVGTSDQSEKTTATSAGESQVAYKMQKNLLIPIPQDIMNEKNLTPQISSSAENIKLENELRANKTLPALPKTGDSISENTETPQTQDAGTAVPVASPFEEDIPTLKDDSAENKESERATKSLSDSIAAWFSSAKSKSSADDIKATDKPSRSQSRSNTNSDQSNSIFNKLLGAKKNNVTPTELKLFFQPNRAEISGQTLEWIRAFADNAAKYENVVVEIRIDKSLPYELQQKRLRLLYRIMANNGVDYSKINIIFTDREPNSFIIRNVRYATDEEKAKNVKTYNPWL